MPADPAAVPPPEWAIRWALLRKWGPLKAPQVRSEDADPDSLALAATAAQFRDGALNEVADRIDAQRAVHEREWEDAAKMGDPAGLMRGAWITASLRSAREAALSLLHTPPSGGAG